jgi:hypothetical protein
MHCRSIYNKCSDTNAAVRILRPQHFHVVILYVFKESNIITTYIILKHVPCIFFYYFVKLYFVNYFTKYKIKNCYHRSLQYLAMNDVLY